MYIIFPVQQKQSKFFLALQFFFLENKPIHHDESVNAWWLTQISQTGFFKYDPTNYHGPLFFYIQWIFERIFGSELWVLRGVAVLFGLISILLLWKRNYKWGAAMMALSPAFFFFSRSGIHESMFVFFQLIFVLGILDFYQKKENAFAWIVFGLVGSLAIKETWVISFLAALIALLFLGKPCWEKTKKEKNIQILMMGFFVWAILFSGFFQYPQGLFDFFVAFIPWLQTGTQGSGHDKAIWFWSELVIRYESIFALLMILSAKYFLKNHKEDKSFAFVFAFFVIQFLIYSLIPYKTPWCLISLLWPLCLLADKIFTKKMIPLLSILIIWQALWIYRLNFQNPIELDHPYVYVQSTQELKNFSDSVNLKSPGEHVAIALTDAWPFPWIFRHQNEVRYINQQTTAEESEKILANADVIVADRDHLSFIEDLTHSFRVQKFFLRRNDLEIYVVEKKK